MIALLVAFAVSSTPTPTPAEPGRVPEGQWGGTGVAVRIGAAGAEIEFDCARGEIAGAIALDAERRFDVAGTFELGRPGPIRQGAEPRVEPARYRGRLEGDTLSFEVILEKSGRPTRNYTAKLGAYGRIRQCG